MAGSHITKSHTPEDKQIVLADLLKQVDQNFDNQHNRQLIAPKYDTDHEHCNANDLQSTIFIDCKFITHKNKSIPSVTSLTH